MKKLKILVVENELLQRTYVCHIIEKMGHLVMEAANAFEAIHLLRKERFDIVLTDNDMAKENEGFEVIDEVRSQDQMLPIIWTSGRADANPELAQKARSLNALVLPKPFQKEQLLVLIEEAAMQVH